jgi:hypothetical protein
MLDPVDPKTLYEWLDGVEVPRRVVALKRGKARVTHTYRWMEGVPLRDGDDAMTVNWLEIVIADAKGNVTYRNSFITDCGCMSPLCQRSTLQFFK